MLWVQQKSNLSLFSTNTDGCCFEWGLVLVKHDKVRDDTPLVTKVWRSSNASAVAFFSQDNLLFMYQLPIKGRGCWGRLWGLFVFLCVRAEVEKWENEQNLDTKVAGSMIRARSAFFPLSNKTNFWKSITFGKELWFYWGPQGSHLENEKPCLNLKLLNTMRVQCRCSRSLYSLIAINILRHFDLRMSNKVTVRLGKPYANLQNHSAIK